MGIITSIAAYRERMHSRRANMQSQRADKKEKENEMLKDNIYATKLQKLKQLFDIRHFSAVENIQHKVFAQTTIDRLTIMFMMNGKVNFKYMTVVWDKSDINPEVGEHIPYKKVPITDEYMNAMSELSPGVAFWQSRPFKRYGAMGQFIEVENIQHIVWFKVKRIALDDYNDLFVYLSWSSENEKTPDWKEKRKLELMTNGMLIPHLIEILEIPREADAVELLEQIETDAGNGK